MEGVAEVEEEAEGGGGGGEEVVVHSSSPISAAQKAQVGDSVYYRMFSGIIKSATIEKKPAGGNGWIIKLNQKLLKQVRDCDLTFGSTPPKCICGKHGGHGKRCYTFR